MLSSLPENLWVYVRGKNAFLELYCRSFFMRGFENPIKTIYFPFRVLSQRKYSRKKKFFTRFKNKKRKEKKTKGLETIEIASAPNPKQIKKKSPVNSQETHSRRRRRFELEGKTRKNTTWILSLALTLRFFSSESIQISEAEDAAAKKKEKIKIDSFK